jgi:N-acetylneuraminate synthase
MSKGIMIGSLKVGEALPPIVVAELSGNHGGSLKVAREMIKAAADAGVQAIKLQTYTADTLTLNVTTEDFLIDEPDSLWRGRSLYDLYAEASTPWDWHESLFKYAEELGLVAFSSPFDESAVDFLETLNVPCYKVASFENNHIPLLKRVAQTGKPIILSTGMASTQEIAEAVACLQDNGCTELILLKCTSHYPATAEGCNLRTMIDMRTRFSCLTGLSDHSLGNTVALTAVALGAVMIEKHFVLDKGSKAVDVDFSLDPREMASLVKETEKAWRSLGGVLYGGAEEEQASKKYRRSIYVSRDVKKGDLISEDNIRVVRPGTGMHPRYYDIVKGEKFACDVAGGIALQSSMVEGGERLL